MSFAVIQLLKYKIIILILVNILPINLKAQDSLVLLINTSEGGEKTQRRLNDFNDYLNQQSCSVSEIKTTSSFSNETDVDLVFAPLKSDLPKQFQKILKLKIINNEAISSSILVRASTGIEQLKALSDVHIAFLSEQSLTGYQLAQELFNNAGVEHKKEKMIFTQTNIGAMSLLIHMDAFVAVVATPLAKKWAKANNLKIVATSKEIKTGGLFAHESIDQEHLENCQKAFLALSEKTRKNKKTLKVFPAWVVGFKD